VRKRGSCEETSRGENTDEFWSSVEDCKYAEVDLKAKRVRDFDDYDEEILEDSNELSLGWAKGTEGQVQSSELSCREIMKKRPSIDC